MSDKHFVGLDLTGFEDNGKTPPISRVTLNVDDENVITAGDDTGLELIAECHHATQEMANAVLAKVKGYQYQMFTADAANVDPAAELGDGITASGVYGVLSRLSDDGNGFPGVEAPGEAELEDEFPIGEGPMTKELNRKLARTRSQITKTAEEIRQEIQDEVNGLETSITQSMADAEARLELLVQNTKEGIEASIELSLSGITSRVDGLDGQYSELSQTVDGFTFTGPDGETYIKGGSIETGSITSDQIKAGSITSDHISADGIDADKLNLTGSITFSDLATDAQGKINSAQSTANGAYLSAEAAQDAADSANDVIQQWGYTYGGKTYIDGTEIMTGTVTASKLQGGTIILLDSSGSTSGELKLSSATSGSYAVELSSSAALRLKADSGDVYMGTNFGNVWIINGDRVQIGGIPLVSSNMSSLGTSSYPWGQIYSTNTAIQTSDANKKHDIEDLPDKYIAMLNTLRPVRFKYNDGASGRYHTGFIAQDVEAAMEQCGISSAEFGGFVLGDDGAGGDVRMLRYGEFIALLWAKAREMDKRIKLLEGTTT